MTRQRSTDNLSVDELRHLLLEKRRSERQSRLKQFSQTRQVLPPAGQTRYEPRTGSQREEIPPSRARKPNSGWLNLLLLVIEVTSAVGLILVLIGSLNVLRQLNETRSPAIAQPTLTISNDSPPAAASPTAPSVVLPAVLPPVQAPPETATPAAGSTPAPTSLPATAAPLLELPEGSPRAVRIRIPAIAVDAPVVQGDDWETLKQGVGQSPINPVDPGQPGNVVLSAHNDVFGEIFRDLDKLQPGDEIILHTEQQEYRYVVQQSQIVAPDQVQWIGQTEEAVVTLVSCYPYQIDSERIIIRAHFEPTSSS